MDSYLYPQPEPDLDDDDIIYDDYIYEIYKALIDYKEVI